MTDDVFREPALERALTVDDVDQLLALHQADELRLTTTSGGLLVHDLDPRPLIGAVLRHARLALILRLLAVDSRSPLTIDTRGSLQIAIAAAEARNRRER